MKKALNLLFFMVFLGCSHIPSTPPQEANNALENPEKKDSYTQENESYNLSVKVPQTGHESIDTIVQDFVDDLVSQFTEIADSTAEERAANNYDNYSMSIEYEEFALTDAIGGYLFTIYEFTGGAHPNSYFVSFVFDLKTGKELTLFDIFGELFEDEQQMYDLIGRLTTEDLKRQLGNEGWPKEGAGINPDNYDTFTFTPDELLIHFTPYEVAPYSMGSQVVTIPLMALQ